MTLTPDMLTDAEEVTALQRLASAVRPGECIVELGVFRGGSLRVLAEAAQPGVPVFGVDTFGGPGTPEYYRPGSDWVLWWERFAGRKSRPLDWAENLRVAHEAAPSAHIIVRDSAETGRTWAGPPVGLLYIDADHSYEGVRADWLAWRSRLAVDARVFFDDYRYTVRGKDHYPGVTRLVDELALPTFRYGKGAVVLP